MELGARKKEKRQSEFVQALVALNTWVCLRKKSGSRCGLKERKERKKVEVKRHIWKGESGFTIFKWGLEGKN